MEKSLFFDSGQEYSMADWATYFKSFASSGVNIFGNLDSLKVVKDSAMAIKVSDGKALINGYYYEAYNNDTLLSLSATTDTARIDRIVLRLNLNQNEWKITAAVKQGTPTTPSALQRDNSIYEMSLATIAIPAGQSTLTTATITDDRAENSLCGILSFMGQQPYYPTGSIPTELWLYANFPDELTTEEKELLESNTSLMEKWAASRIKSFYTFVPKRDATGAIIYALENSNDTEQTIDFGDLTVPGVYSQSFEALEVSPLYKKRFLKLQFDAKKQSSSTSAYITYKISLKNADTLEELQLYGELGSAYQTYTHTKVFEILPGQTGRFLLQSKITLGEGYSNDVVYKIKNFRAYMEDAE